MRERERERARMRVCDVSSAGCKLLRDVDENFRVGAAYQQGKKTDVEAIWIIIGLVNTD